VFQFAPILHHILTDVSHMQLYVAELDSSGPLVGAGVLKTCEALVPLGPHIQPIGWAVSDMITHPNYRRQGIGRALLRHMEGAMVRQGGRILYLYTEVENLPAIRLYQSAGFERLADQRSYAVFCKVTRN